MAVLSNCSACSIPTFPPHLEQQRCKTRTPNAQAPVTAGCCAHTEPHGQRRGAAGVHLVHRFDDNSLAADLVHAACSATETALPVRQIFVESETSCSS